MRASSFVLWAALFTAGCSPAQSQPDVQPPQASAESPTETSLGKVADEGPIWSSTARIQKRCDTQRARAQALLDELKAKGSEPATVANTLVPLNDIRRTLDDVWGQVGVLGVVHPDKAIRDEADACGQRLSAFASAMALDRELYDRVASIPLADADPATLHVHKRLMQNFTRSGVDKDDATRARLTEINQRLVELQQAFGRNIQEDRREVEVSGVEGLKGLPADFIKEHPPRADGKIVVNTDYPDLFPILAYADDHELRAELYRAFLNRGYPANAETLPQVLELRREKAKLLGYDNWPAYATVDMMSGDAKTVETFINDLVAVARPRARKESKLLLKSLKKQIKGLKHLYESDASYALNQHVERKYGVDPQEVRNYFSYPKVRDGMLALYAELFEVEFVRLDEVPVWHASVEAYSMRRSGEELGRFFLDMHPRDGKYKHAAMFDIITGDSQGRRPEAALVCNFADPSRGDGKALMEHSQVSVFFHEFGHLIHFLMATSSPWLADNGISTEDDFVEAPSQLLEEWVWDPAVLARFARHVDTGAPIPADLVARMVAAKDFGKGLWAARQLFYAAFSYYLHTEDPEKLDLETFSGRMFSKYHPYRRPEGEHLFANNGHVMGYSSNVYTYQWSMMIAKDLFTRFEKAGLLDTETAHAYRDAVLRPGGTKPAAQLVRDFLGRDFTLDAYRKWLEE